MQAATHCQISSPGPWGELECFHTYLDPPDSYFDTLIRQRKTQWFFPDRDRDEVQALFERLRVPAPTGESEWVVANNGVLLEPTLDFLESLTPEEAVRITAEVLSTPGNSSSLNDFVIERGSYREFTEGLDIPEDLVEWTEGRCFRTGQKTVFASTGHALSRITDDGLRLRFLKSLARCRSLIARLRIRPGQDLAEISRWWSAGPNRCRSLPLLEAALSTRGVETIDLLHLLPAVPRRLLNTYAHEQDRWQDMSPDCYWASMNFFESTASSRYLDDSMPRSYYFADRFDMVEPPYEFGDIIMLCDLEEDRFIHSYVYIADDIVYTKNGAGKFFPYVLMKMDDMLTRYLAKDTYTTAVYRLRNLAAVA